MKTISKTLNSLLLLIALTVFACSKNSGYMNNNNTSSSPFVSIKNMAFSAGILKISAGTTVKWTNNDGMTHTVTADDASFDSGNIAPGASFSQTFNAKGTFAYHCSIHAGMKATVEVQ